MEEREAEKAVKSSGDECRSNHTAAAIFRALGAAVFVLLLLTVLLFWYADRIRDLALDLGGPKTAVVTNLPSANQFAKELQRLRKTVEAQKSRLANLIPKTPYLIINTSENKITLMKGNEVLHEGLCSTGSYTVLKTADGKEMWIFQTPRGMLRVQNKLVNPVWRMPDWAFIEEGLPVPPPYAPERYERNVLGDYALDLGRGYLIHGTLYQRFLGMPVTHGCVRLGDQELEIVYHTLDIGSKVYIY
ncbi:MAG: L,D-transpeptidase [candidate division KSB1 bacterium]|nr:L,D-transpeptidase [candidate division KSB1 bacterium]